MLKDQIAELEHQADQDKEREFEDALAAIDLVSSSRCRPRAPNSGATNGVAKSRSISFDTAAEGKKKRYRRVANDIERNYVCSACSKTYGSEGSLNQHTKLKHPEQTKELLAANKL